MIQLSPAATSEIKRLKSKQQPHTLVRLAVKPGGCSDLFYDLSFDEIVTQSDRIFEINELKILIDDESLNYLDGLALDYSEDLMGGGFRFHNPQAVSTCSCGNSFSVSQELVVYA
ncbi:iron-sulfur cluster assembly accessory protein [Nostoc sp. FACHB-110]|uniref:HesB/IscA family protein n=1 Tax=Nostoc sp. FACHB-110 TaxID=2692834 RepID=UPI0016897086|nr:iron-sulfur cluster assembly accessory protein [Nostoc sp. FACHB-110]MBD2441204.1 iron-sulfur cluster assembly accessory protein [Nostoc sp. FACHB-110]